MSGPPGDALGVAARALERRDLSQARLREKLDAAGISNSLARETVQRLVDSGLVDDARTAALRAEGLARRGYGDLGIDARLEKEGFHRDCRQAALAQLEPEADRALAALSRAGGRDRRKVVASLERHGFGFDAIESALAVVDAPE